MSNDCQAVLRRLLPALLVLVACGGATSPGATTGSAGSAGGAAGASGAAGGGGDVGGAGATGSGGAGTTGTAGTSDGGAGTTGTGGTSDGGGGTIGTAGAPDGGAPDAPPTPDAELNPAGGTALPPYDGGLVNVINSTNWNETTIHPFNKRRMIVRDENDPHLMLLDFSLNPSPLVWKKVTNGAWTRGIQLVGNNQVMGSTTDGYEVFDVTTGAIVKTVKGFPTTQSAYRMANGETMLTQGPVAPATFSITLSFLDKTDRISHAIRYPGFSYVRMVRPTRNGTFLVPSDQTVFEGDATGKVLWKLTNGAPGWGHIWEPLLMSDGNVLLATAFGTSLDVIDKTTHMVTRRYGTKQMPDAATFRPNFFAEFQILPNGNLITTNWQSRGPGIGNLGVQIIEFDPSGAVAWFWKQDPTFVSSLQGLLVLDGMDPRFLHAQEISPDSTWQPVIPTP
jgi:hypothetical protein